jgi:5-formyltetrahydrofolate cyclo-ligase
MREALRASRPLPGDAEARAVCRRVVGLREFGEAACVALFASLPDEVSTRPLFDASRRAGKRCLLPRATAGGRLEFVEVERWEDLRPGRYGVPEPTARAVASLSDAQVVVVPGLAFDASGGRLGRGGGHYDRALAGLDRTRCLVIGLGLSRQWVDEVPSGALDQKVDVVVTERDTARRDR